jgi:hypothetical protein
LTFGKIMKAFLVVFSPSDNDADEAVTTHLKSFSRYREVMRGAWVVVSSKSATDLHDSISKHLPDRHRTPCAVFRIDGRALDWQVRGVPRDTDTWLFENLSIVFPKVR